MIHVGEKLALEHVLGGSLSFSPTRESEFPKLIPTAKLNYCINI